MKEIDISVIIPVFNGEKTLERCMKSVLGQTIHSLEIICVDDGSADESLSLLYKYAEMDARVNVISKKNQGAMAARRAGVRMAKGNYVGFVDCDDYIELDMFESLMKYAVSYDADMVTSSYIQEGEYISIQHDSADKGFYDNERMHGLRDKMILDVTGEDLGISGALWTKLFRTDLLKKVYESIPDQLVFSEDKMCVITFLLEAKSAVITKDAYYHYFLNPQSLTHQPDTNYLEHVNNVYKYLISLYDHPNFTLAMRMHAELYVTQLVIKGINTRMGFFIRNLLWVDPYWIERIPKGSLVALYGGGDLGRKYYEQLQASGRMRFAGCVDYNFERMQGAPFEIVSPTCLGEMEYDHIIITIKKPEKAKEIKERLIEDGIDEDKICWFEQKEIFWRFAEAEGLAGKGIDAKEGRQ